MSEHYFTSAPLDPSQLIERQVHLRGQEYSIVSAPGVFSHDRVDKATTVLLAKAPLPQLGRDARVLDAGCGWGPIALALAATYPRADVWATDVNERARELTAMNAGRAGLHIHVATPEDAAAQLGPGSVDLIWSNPPIRIGKDALHAMLTAHLRLLSPIGSASLVVGKNLGADSLASWLNSHGYACTKIASQKGFRVLDVRPGAE